MGIAQLARAPDCGSGGHRFKSDYPPHRVGTLLIITVGVSPSGKAMDFDSIIRWFESSHPSHSCFKYLCEPLAQLVEHLTFNPVVRGSSPRWLTIVFLKCVFQYSKYLLKGPWFFYESETLLAIKLFA